MSLKDKAVASHTDYINREKERLDKALTKQKLFHIEIFKKLLYEIIMGEQGNMIIPANDYTIGYDGFLFGLLCNRYGLSYDQHSLARMDDFEKESKYKLGICIKKKPTNPNWFNPYYCEWLEIESLADLGKLIKDNCEFASQKDWELYG